MISFANVASSNVIVTDLPSAANTEFAVIAVSVPSAYSKVAAVAVAVVTGSEKFTFAVYLSTVSIPVTVARVVSVSPTNDLTVASTDSPVVALTLSAKISTELAPSQEVEALAKIVNVLPSSLNEAK